MSYNEAWRNEPLTDEDKQAILETESDDARQRDGNEELAKHLWTLHNIKCEGEYMTP